MRFEKFGMRLLSSFCTHLFETYSPAGRSLSVDTKMSRPMPWPRESRPCTFAKYSGFELTSS